MSPNCESKQLVRYNTFQNQVIIVDGQGRSGKNLIAVLLSTMVGVGKMRLDSHIDYIPRYWSLGKMSLDAAVVALRIEFDEKLYYDAISRDVNFRFEDYTGVFKQGRRWSYIKNLFMRAGPEVLQQIIEDRRIFQEMTHDGIQFFDLFIKALGERLKFVHVLRNPVHNIYEQNRRGLGQRIGADPTELQLTFNYENQPVPLMAVGREELWLNGSELERLVVMVDSMFRKNVMALNKFSELWGEQIFLIEFEEFLKMPLSYMKRLEQFIGRSFGSSSRRILRRERCPRIIPESQLTERISLLRKEIGNEYQVVFDQMIVDYEKFVIEKELK